MQIQPETIIWNQPSASSVKVAKNTGSQQIFAMEKLSGSRIDGSMPVWRAPKTPEEKISANLSQAAKPAGQPALAAALTDTTDANKPNDSSFGFKDLLDMVNPLQHIPLVSTIYRNITGDTINPVSRVVGDAAFGGPIGAASGLVNAIVQMQTGKDVTGNMMASFEGTSSATTATQANDTTIAVANLRARSSYNS